MKVRINNKVLKWARESVNLSIDEVIDKIKMQSFTKDDLINFENGNDLPDLKLAKKLSKLYGINLTVLYMRYIPKNIQPKINDFRQINNKLSKNAVFLIRELASHQEWVREYLISNNAEELDFVGSISMEKTSIEEAVSIIKKSWV